MSNLHPWPQTGHTIDFIQHVRADPQRVWEALTTEDGLRRWLRVTDAEIPTTAGRPYRLTWESIGRAGGRNTRVQEGVVAAVSSPVLLALEWRLPTSGAMTYLSVQIQQSYALFGESREQECDIWLIHSGFPTHGVAMFEYDGYLRHWRQDIGVLAAWLEARPGKPTPYALAGLQFVGGAYGVGLLVADVFIGSPAHEAGIVAGDIIRAVDGHPLHSLDDFHEWIDARMPGESGRFTLTDREVTVTVESVEAARARFQLRQGDVWKSRFDPIGVTP
jgi:uncharacterized protein YndB with AHSA1/START domain